MYVCISILSTVDYLYMVTLSQHNTAYGSTPACIDEDQYNIKHVRTSMILLLLKISIDQYCVKRIKTPKFLRAKCHTNPDVIISKFIASFLFSYSFRIYFNRLIKHVSMSDAVEVNIHCEIPNIYVQNLMPTTIHSCF